MIGKNKRKAALEALAAYADELRTEIERQTARMKRELESVEQSIIALTRDGAQDVGQEQAGVTLGVGGKYAGVGPQAAVEKFLGEHPGQTFRSAEVADQLQAGGLAVSNPKLMRQQVLIALDRAVKKGVATETRSEGRRTFRLKVADLPRQEERK